MSPKEKRALQKTKLRNLKRKYGKIVQHPEFVDEIHELKKEITELEKELEKWK